MACEGRQKIESGASSFTVLAEAIAVAARDGTGGNKGACADRSAVREPGRESVSHAEATSLEGERFLTSKSCSPLRYRSSSTGTSPCSSVRRSSLPSCRGGAYPSSPLPPSSFAYAATVAAWRTATRGVAPRTKPRAGGGTRNSRLSAEERKLRESPRSGAGGSAHGRSREEGCEWRVRGYNRTGRQEKGVKKDVLGIAPLSSGRTWEGTGARRRRREKKKYRCGGARCSDTVFKVGWLS